LTPRSTKAAFDGQNLPHAKNNEEARLMPLPQ